ncbi:hypothetical protein O181_070581 [Austropuccinia psidii MF-1]|uniref:Uncharacterized protein n=1 Tax=Austropuccinia psidii MF-1 TaxID=1389203 RepID=A0A9Q3EZ19_9BASI|nr:hypothetical protein [Austropuccinia psidii MF-1]
MSSIGTIIKKIIITHKKGTDYQRIYGIDIYSSKNRHITTGTNKNKFSLYIYQISNQYPLEDLLNELKEEKFNSNLTSKQKLGLLKILRKNRPAFAIGGEPLGKIRGHDIELYLYLERPYPPILGRPPFQEGLDNRKEIEKNFNRLLDMDVIRKIGNNEIVLCGDFRVLNNYTRADRYPIPRIPHAMENWKKKDILPRWIE